MEKTSTRFTNLFWDLQLIVHDISKSILITLLRVLFYLCIGVTFVPFLGLIAHPPLSLILEDHTSTLKRIFSLSFVLDDHATSNIIPYWGFQCIHKNSHWIIGTRYPWTNLTPTMSDSSHHATGHTFFSYPRSSDKWMESVGYVLYSMPWETCHIFSLFFMFPHFSFPLLSGFSVHGFCWCFSISG
jgi:hypothetical protein